MRQSIRRAATLLGMLVFALLAAPGGSLAAPTLTVTPATGPARTVFVLSGSGYEPNQSIHLYVLSCDEQFVCLGQQPIDCNCDFHADANGAFTTSYLTSNLGPGFYKAEVKDRATNTSLAAPVTFTVTGAPAVPTPSPTVALPTAPAPSPTGTTVAAPSATTPIAASPTPRPTMTTVPTSAPVAASPTPRPAPTIAPTPTAPAAMPGLPNTGAGGAADRGGAGQALLAGLGLLGMLGLALRRARRGRAA